MNQSTPSSSIKILLPSNTSDINGEDRDMTKIQLEAVSVVSTSEAANVSTLRGSHAWWSQEVLPKLKHHWSKWDLREALLVKAVQEAIVSCIWTSDHTCCYFTVICELLQQFELVCADLSAENLLTATSSVQDKVAKAFISVTLLKLGICAPSEHPWDNALLCVDSLESPVTASFIRLYACLSLCSLDNVPDQASLWVFSHCKLSVKKFLQSTLHDPSTCQSLEYCIQQMFMLLFKLPHDKIPKQVSKFYAQIDTNPYVLTAIIDSLPSDYLLQPKVLTAYVQLCDMQEYFESATLKDTNLIQLKVYNSLLKRLANAESIELDITAVRSLIGLASSEIQDSASSQQAKKLFDVECSVLDSCLLLAMIYFEAFEIAFLFKLALSLHAPVYNVRWLLMVTAVCPTNLLPLIQSSAFLSLYRSLITDKAVSQKVMLELLKCVKWRFEIGETITLTSNILFMLKSCLKDGNPCPTIVLDIIACIRVSGDWRVQLEFLSHVRSIVPESDKLLCTVCHRALTLTAFESYQAISISLAFVLATVTSIGGCLQRIKLSILCATLALKTEHYNHVDVSLKVAIADVQEVVDNHTTEFEQETELIGILLALANVAFSAPAPDTNPFLYINAYIGSLQKSPWPHNGEGRVMILIRLLSLMGTVKKLGSTITNRGLYGNTKSFQDQLNAYARDIVQLVSTHIEDLDSTFELTGRVNDSMKEYGNTLAIRILVLGSELLDAINSKSLDYNHSKAIQSTVKLLEKYREFLDLNADNKQNQKLLCLWLLDAQEVDVAAAVDRCLLDMRK